MSIWHTTQPTSFDLPIWAYIYSDIEFIKDFEGVVVEDVKTWTPAEVPNLPDESVEAKLMQKFQSIADSNISDWWSSSDWFKAGYEYAQEENGSALPIEDQAKKQAGAPFVDPVEYHSGSAI